ncbi:MAG: hypothetical protein M3P85_14010 [Actinomycetota bacterium]|nr:hypothetical protein [Actinomycetota bacterium]
MEAGLAASIATCLIVLTVIHDLDHVRQGRSLDPELYVVAVLALVSTSATLVLLRHRHPAAGLVAVGVGAATPVGVAAVHVAPRRSLFSDSYFAAGADPMSWLIIVLMMITGLALAGAGLPALRLLRGSGAKPQKRLSVFPRGPGEAL